MACSSIRGLQRICLLSLLKHSSSSPSHTPILPNPQTLSTISTPFNLTNPRWVFKNWSSSSSSHGSVNLVISQGGQPRFETNEIEPPKKEKWQTKKRLKMQRKREKKKRNAANKRDPRRIGVKGGRKVKQRFVSAEERIKCKIEKAKIKEGLLIERLRRYEVPKLQGPMVKQDDMTGEERFYMKKMAQKGSNYVPVGRRGVFGGVILNMHMHWKKHETVEVICKPCKPGQVRDYANEIARLSGGIPIHIIGDDTIIFYRGKNYVQPEVMSPIDTLSKKRALEKSKYEQSLESVRRFIAIAEKELELYYRHVALYGDPNSRNPNLILDSPIKGTDKRKKVEMLHQKTQDSTSSRLFRDLSTMENDSTDQELLLAENDSTDQEISSDTEDDSKKEELSFRETVSQSRGNSFSQGKEGKSIGNSDHQEFRAVNLKL